MKLSAFVSLITAILLVACGNGHHTVVEPLASEAKAPQQARTRQSCEYPDVMKSAEDAGDVPGLLEHLNGKYELEAIHVFAFRPLTTGGIGKSIYATLTQGNVLNIECNQGGSISIDAVNVWVKAVSVIHTPSTRVTEFDDTQGTFDNPQFNFPTLIDVGFSSDGANSLLRVQGMPPYKSNLYLGDLSKQWPLDQRLSIRTDGKAGFQIFYNDPKAQNTSVLMIYAPATGTRAP